MFAYPSGERLHVGRWFSYIPADARARYLRMRGYNVMFPIGFDAFGLPAENAAIRRGVHPYRWTMDNIETMRRQFRSMGGCGTDRARSGPATPPITSGTSGSS